MHAVEIQTTKKKFIISIDKNRMDSAAFLQFVEDLKAKILTKEITSNKNKTNTVTEESEKTPLFLALQRFKGIATSDYPYSKYDVYEQ